MSSSGMSLRGKLTAMTIATIAALAVLFTVLLMNEKNQMMADRQAKVRNLVEVAHTTVAFYDAEAKAGRMTLDEAKTGAKNAIRNMRYDKVEYFWINDLQDLMVMHPIKPELEGKKLDQLKDKNGKFLFLEFNKVVNAQGAGFVDYLWPKPGAEEGVQKISYVMGYQPWGWVIGSGIYTDDVDAQFRADAIKLLMWGLFATLSARSVVSPLSLPQSANASQQATWLRPWIAGTPDQIACWPISAICKPPCAA
jgi:methyl-accepting chemotaxis protein